MKKNKRFTEWSLNLEGCASELLLSLLLHALSHKSVLHEFFDLLALLDSVGGLTRELLLQVLELGLLELFNLLLDRVFFDLLLIDLLVKHCLGHDVLVVFAQTRLILCLKIRSELHRVHLLKR
jgi:hypothetical protein